MIGSYRVLIIRRQQPVQAPMYAVETSRVSIIGPINESPSKRGCGRFYEGATLVSVDYLEQQVKQHRKC